ncbi:MAG: acyl carrier protein [Dongiaceae bacterium]
MAATDDDVFQTIAATLKPSHKGEGTISADTNLTQDFNLDSVGVMDLMMELEEKFDVSIPLNLLPEIQTVGDLASTIKKLKMGI